MKGFELVEPQTLDEALALVDSDDPGVRVLAGATALMLMMKARLFQPRRLISLRRLDGALRGIRHDAGGRLHVGAMTTLADMERSPLVARSAPVVSRALGTLSNVRVRNVATLGGHLALGDRSLDLPPILLAQGARVRAVSRRGDRWIDINDFIVGYYQTALDADELVAEVDIAPQQADARAAYLKFTALSADDWPAVGVAVWYRLEQPRADRILEARVSVSAATERAMRLPAAEAALAGGAVSPETFASAADAAADSVHPMSDNRGSGAYKKEMVRVHVRRALEQALRDGVAPAP